jgi:polyisoprenoid-binding protein YceI
LRKFFLSLVLGLASTAALAAPQWTVDPARSKLTFEVIVNGQTVVGTFKSFGALVTFAPDDLPGSKAKITIDMTDFASGDKTRDTMLFGPNWFNAKDFPKATFETTAFEFKGNDKPNVGSYDVKGKLTLRGVSKDIVLPLSITITGSTAHVVGETTLTRTDFTVGQGKEFAGPTPVALQVKVNVDLTATKP